MRLGIQGINAGELKNKDFFVLNIQVIETCQMSLLYHATNDATRASSQDEIIV